MNVIPPLEVSTKLSADQICFDLSGLPGSVQPLLVDEYIYVCTFFPKASLTLLHPMWTFSTLQSHNLIIFELLYL